MNFMLTLFYGLVMAFSGGTTAVGAFTWLSSEISVVPSLMISLFGSLLIQCGIGAFYQRAAVTLRNKFMVTGLCWLSIAIPLTMISGGFASGANTFVWQATVAQQRLDDSVVSMASSPAQTLIERATSIDRAFTDFAEFSQEESDHEAATGQSCDGQSLGDECGLICALRAEQALEATEKAEVAQALLGSAEDLLTTASGPISQDQVNRIWKESRQLTRSPEIKDLLAYVRRQLDGFRGAGFETPKGIRQCEDAEAVEHLIKIEHLLTEPIGSPAIPPTVRQVELSDVALGNFAALSAATRTVISDGSMKAVMLSEDATFYGKFWIFSALIELLCAVLGMRYALAKLPDQPTNVDLGIVYKAKTQRAELLYDLWLPMTLRQSGSTYFCMPIGGCPNTALNAFVFSNQNSLIERFGGATVDIYEWAEEMEAKQFENATGTRFARIYKVRNPRRFERKLANLIGYTESVRRAVETEPDPDPDFDPDQDPDSDPDPDNEPDETTQAVPEDDSRVIQFPGVQARGRRL